MPMATIRDLANRGRLFGIQCPALRNAPMARYTSVVTPMSRRKHESRRLQKSYPTTPISLPVPARESTHRTGELVDCAGALPFRRRLQFDERKQKMRNGARRLTLPSFDANSLGENSCTTPGGQPLGRNSPHESYAQGAMG